MSSDRRGPRCSAIRLKTQIRLKKLRLKKQTRLRKATNCSSVPYRFLLEGSSPRVCLFSHPYYSRSCPVICPNTNVHYISGICPSTNIISRLLSAR